MAFLFASSASLIVLSRSRPRPLVCGLGVASIRRTDAPRPFGAPDFFLASAYARTDFREDFIKGAEGVAD